MASLSSYGFPSNGHSVIWLPQLKVREETLFIQNIFWASHCEKRQCGSDKIIKRDHLFSLRSWVWGLTENTGMQLAHNMQLIFSECPLCTRHCYAGPGLGWGKLGLTLGAKYKGMPKKKKPSVLKIKTILCSILKNQNKCKQIHDEKNIKF